MHLKTGVLALIAVCAPLAQAHCALQEFFVNGKGRGQGTCIRMNTISKPNLWVPDITSDDMACGKLLKFEAPVPHYLQSEGTAGGAVVGRTCPIQAGDTISFNWRLHPGQPQDTRITYGAHWGPCAIYMKQISTDAPASDGSFPSSPPAAGDGWFKIMYDVKDDAGVWCMERLKDSKDGAISAIIPKDVKPGYYLLRAEVMSLTHARKGQDSPQIYIGCVQAYITGGSGTANPPTVPIPGYVHPDDAAMKYNVYNKPPRALPEIGGPTYSEGGNLIYDTKWSVNQTSSGSDESSASSKTTSVATSSTASDTSTESESGYGSMDPDDAADMPSGSNEASSSVTGTEGKTTTTTTLTATTITTADALSVGTTATITATTAAATTPSKSAKGCRPKRKRSILVARNEMLSHLPPRQSDPETPKDPFACPAGTIMELGNMCLPALQKWDDTADPKRMPNCKESEKTCWAVAEKCGLGRNPAVNNDQHQGCRLYRDKCYGIKLMCQDKLLKGPPNADEIITPKPGVLTSPGIGLEKRGDVSINFLRSFGHFAAKFVA